MIKQSIYPIHPAHLAPFGGIVQQFARFERLIEIAVSAFLNESGYVYTAMVMAGLGYSAKCDALKSLITLSGLTESEKLAFKAHIDDFNHYAPLRNSIAHHTWKEGKQKGAVKAMSVMARGGGAKLRGVKDDEPEYTVEDLVRAHDTLIKLHDNFRGFMLAMGMMEHVLKTDATMARSSPTKLGG